MKTKKTLDYFKSRENNALSALLNKVEKITALDKAVKSCLNGPLAEHCHVANLRQGRLILQADNPVWGSKLRFESSSLLARLRENPLFAGLVGIDFFVAPLPSPLALSFQQATTAKIAARQKNRAISLETRQLLKETAEDITDPRLQAVLRAIAEKG